MTDSVQTRVQQVLDTGTRAVIRHLMRQEDMTQQEAIKELQDMRERVTQGEDPEEMLHEIGLEPDYIFALI